MDVECIDIVDKINEILAQRVGLQKYKIWFKNSTRMTVEDNYVKVGVPNLFIGGWIENHFESEITEVVSEVLQRPMKVIFNIDPALFGSQRRAQLDSQAESVAKSTNPSSQKRQAKPKRQPAKQSLRLKLGDFVVGSCNRLAYNAAKMVASEPKIHFNPLFIHGSCGLGKTHLLQGICNAMRKERPQSQFMYVSGEEFTNQFVMSLKKGNLDQFRHRFRQNDLLVIDDVHFLASKKATQEEFLHTFNAIDATSRQVVLASDAHPKMIGQLSDGLVNRFVAGMVVKIDPPDYQTRCSILRQRSVSMNKHVPEPVFEYIADNIRANVRELEGALLKVVAYASMGQVPVTLSLAREALDDHIARADPMVQLSDIESVVATYFGLTTADVHSSRKTRTISLARSLTMFLSRKHTTMSYPEIGRFMGGKNHATVILACKKVNNYLKNNEVPVAWQSPAGRRETYIEPLIEKLEMSICH